MLILLLITIQNHVVNNKYPYHKRQQAFASDIWTSFVKGEFILAVKSGNYLYESVHKPENGFYFGYTIRTICLEIYQAVADKYWFYMDFR